VVEHAASDADELVNPFGMSSRIRRPFVLFSVIALITFAALTWGVFSRFGWPPSASEFGSAISGISAIFTPFALAGAWYAVMLQREALELQRQQMSKEIGEVREQTKMLADRFQEIAPIGRAYDRLDATETVLNTVLDGAKKSIQEAIYYLPSGFIKDDLNKSLEAFLDSSEKYIEAGSAMEIQCMARGLARGGIVKARQVWVSRREELARQLGIWADGIRKGQAEADARSNTSQDTDV
jgi:hypothetical protein